MVGSRSGAGHGCCSGVAHGPRLDHRRRQRGCCLGGAPRQRGRRHLPDHPLVGDGRARGRLVGGRAPQHLGPGAIGHRDAIRRRRHRRRARRPPGGRAGDDVHGQPGPVADDPEPLQDRRRADPVLLPRRGAHRRHARALDLRRSLRRDGLPADRRRHAGLGVGAGGAGLRPHRPGRDAARPRAAAALLRRVPHLARGVHDPGARATTC